MGISVYYLNNIVCVKCVFYFVQHVHHFEQNKITLESSGSLNKQSDSSVFFILGHIIIGYLLFMTSKCWSKFSLSE